MSTGITKIAVTILPRRRGKSQLERPLTSDLLTEKLIMLICNIFLLFGTAQFKNVKNHLQNKTPELASGTAFDLALAVIKLKKKIQIKLPGVMSLILAVLMDS